MADVYTYTFIIIGILLSLPALLVGLNILMPRVTERVQIRLLKTPGRSFLLGMGITAVALLFTAITAQANLGPVRALAFVSGITYAGLGTIGAAGMTRLIGQRLSSDAQTAINPANLLRGAIVYELACFFPIVGWFLFAPLVGMTVVGAASFALLKWLPRSVSSEQSAVISIQAADLN